MSDTAEPEDIHDRGLAFDRRRMFTLMGIAGTGTLLAACDLFGPPRHSEPNRTATAADGSTCIKAPAETSGPFPGDGSNARKGSTLNVLPQSGIVRTDIRPSFGGMKPVAAGTQLDLTIALVDVSNGCAPLFSADPHLRYRDRAASYHDLAPRQDAVRQGSPRIAAPSDQTHSPALARYADHHPRR